MSRLFGTDGVRGIANSELTPELAFELGKAGAYVLSKETEKPLILIGMDTRISGDMLESAISAGIQAVGGDVIRVGVVPTPAVAFLVKYYNADAGVMISASHNPFEYNGIKFFNRDGFKLDDSVEDEIEDIIVRHVDVNSHITGEKLGRSQQAEENSVEIYSGFLKAAADIDLGGRKIVLDCANGAAYQVAEKVYRELGAKTVVIADKPNGININLNCGSTHTENLQKVVLEENAFMGMAFDGDADRLIAVDEKGNVIDGDRLICIAAGLLQKKGKLSGNVVTTTVMSNLGLHKYLEKLDIKVDVTDVGDRYVLERMRKTGCSVGGEQSGHIIFLDYTTTGDGILSSLQVLKAIIESGKTASELAEEIEIFPQVLVNAKVKNENKEVFHKDDEVVAKIAEVEEKLAGEGRVLIRPSGTEPLVRVMIEGADSARILAMAEELSDLISSKFEK